MVSERGALGPIVDFAWQDRGVTWRRRWTVSAARATLDLELTVGGAPGHAMMLGFDLVPAAAEAWMAVPGGVVARPAAKRFDPTFWPFERWAALVTPDGLGVGVVAPANPALTHGAGGVFDVVLTRGEGSDCAGSAARDAVSLSLKLVALAPRVELVEAMDGAAAEGFEPLLAARPAVNDLELPVSGSLGEIRGPARLARFARTPDGIALTLERRMREPAPAPITLTIAIDPAPSVEAIDADEAAGEPLATDGPAIELVLDASYRSLRFRVPGTR
jgi:hypothetical protein